MCDEFTWPFPCWWTFRWFPVFVPVANNHIYVYVCIYVYSKYPTNELSSLELSKMQTSVPSTSGVSEIAACPPSPIAGGDPSALPSPTSSLSSSDSSPLFTRCHPGCPSLYCLTVLFKVLYYKGKNVLFFVLLCITCEKYYVC